MSKLFLMALCFAVLRSAVCTGSVLGDAAASMKAGEWRDLQANGMDYGMLYYDVNGDYTNPVTDYSDNLSWDPTGNEALYVGSGNYYTYKFLRYSAVTNTWRSDPNLPACMKNRGCNWHAFDNGSMDEVNRKYYFINSSGLWTYSVATSQWSSALALPSNMAQGVGSAMEYFPSLNGLASVIGGTVTVYNLTTHQVTVAATGLVMAGYNQVAAYSPTFRKFFFGGDAAGNFYSMDSAKKVVKVANAPGLLHENNSTLTTDPATGKILYLGDPQSSNAGKLFVYNPDSDTWQSAGNAPQTGHALATPVSNEGVVLFLFPATYKTYIYKHAAGGTALEKGTLPSAISLSVSPNPIASHARFTLGTELKAGPATLALYDCKGRKIATLAASTQGVFNWSTAKAPAGVYLVKAELKGKSATKWITVVK